MAEPSYCTIPVFHGPAKRSRRWTGPSTSCMLRGGPTVSALFHGGPSNPTPACCNPSPTAILPQLARNFGGAPGARLLLGVLSQGPIAVRLLGKSVTGRSRRGSCRSRALGEELSRLISELLKFSLRVRPISVEGSQEI